jgi:signal transduction histidine kinase
VSHDLRTPITRMRLRAEFMSDTLERERMIHDLDLMDQLTQSALTHLKAVKDGSDREAVDLASLLHSVADRFQDMGKAVVVSIEARANARARPIDLDRALGNLIENAFKYGTPPVLRLRRTGDDAVIEIEDRGPGIPAAAREAMMRPFTRGDSARSMEDASGFGLGLAIARDAIVRQGGTFALCDAAPRGLLVRITLPAS